MLTEPATLSGSYDLCADVAAKSLALTVERTIKAGLQHSSWKTMVTSHIADCSLLFLLLSNHILHLIARCLQRTTFPIVPGSPCVLSISSPPTAAPDALCTGAKEGEKDLSAGSYVQVVAEPLTAQSLQW